MIKALLGVVLWAGILASVSAARIRIPERVEWMEEGGYGISYRFTPTKLGAHNLTTWNEAVDRFDVEGFASQAAKAGAAWVIFSLGDNSGYWCSPNQAYVRHAGHALGRCSNRDLPQELIHALAPHGIRLILRMPSRAPIDDPIAAGNFDDREAALPASQAFNAKWHEVIREWALRYGAGLSGWYFDGAYNWAGWDDYDKPYNFNTWAEAARAGNPDAALTFNSRKVEYFAKRKKKQPAEMDYMPSEAMDGFTRAPERSHWAVAPDTLMHGIVPLSGAWGEMGYSQMEPDSLASWVKALTDTKATITLDVGVWSIGERHGYIPPWQMEALEKVNSLVRHDLALPAERPEGMDDLGRGAQLILNQMSRYHKPELAGQIFTAGAGLNGQGFVTDVTQDPYAIVRLSETATVHRIELYRSPEINWDPTGLTLWIWNPHAGEYSTANSLTDKAWLPVWQAKEIGWKWILNIPDGMKLKQFKVGLQGGKPVSFTLGRIKIYGSGPDYEKIGLPKDWAARQRVLQEQKAKEAAAEASGEKKKKRGFSLNPFR